MNIFKYGYIPCKSNKLRKFTDFFAIFPLIELKESFYVNKFINFVKNEGCYVLSLVVFLMFLLEFLDIVSLLILRKLTVNYIMTLSSFKSSLKTRN